MPAFRKALNTAIGKPATDGSGQRHAPGIQIADQPFDQLCIDVHLAPARGGSHAIAFGHNHAVLAVGQHTHLDQLVDAPSHRLQRYLGDARDFCPAHAALSEPDWIRRGVSRAEVSRITQIPLETVRRRINRLIEMGVLADRKDGVIVPESNRMAAASRRRKMHINTQLIERLISDLDARGVPLS